MINSSHVNDAKARMEESIFHRLYSLLDQNLLKLGEGQLPDVGTLALSVPT